MKNKKFLFEDITFKKGNGMIFMTSDLESPGARTKETIDAKDIAKEHGFKWNKTMKLWYTSENNFEDVKKLANALKTCKESFESLDEIYDMVKNGDEPSEQEVKVATQNGAKLTRKDEVLQQIESFYEGLDDDLDQNQYWEISKEYMDFVLRFKNRFNKTYSVNNLILIFIQNPRASVVGTFNDWKNEGRRVKKGESGIMIYKGVPIKEKDENGDVRLDDEGNEIKRMAFSPMFVFDITQTERSDGQEDPAPSKNDWQPSNDPNDKAREISDILIEVIKSDGIKLSFDPSRHGEGGFSANNKINITSDTQGARLLSVLVHEYAHELLHWEKGPFTAGKRSELTSETKEIQAEGIAYAIMKYYGFDVTANKTYLQNWRGLAGQKDVRISDHVKLMTKVCGYIVNKIHSFMNNNG